MEFYIIHREDRPERLDDLRKELAEQNINAHLFKAIITKRGWDGCKMSHLSVLRQCQSKLVFGVFEDDVKFINPLQPTLDMVMKELPMDWDVLYLGASPREQQKLYSPHLYKLNNALCCHAMIWHSRPSGALDFVLSYRDTIKKIDDFMASVIQPNFNCFVTKPMICTQRQFQSDTCKRSDVSTIEKNYNKYCQ